MITRKQVIDHARTYLGTPFAHQGRTRLHSLDCVGLILCVGAELGLKDINAVPFDKFSYRDYGPEPMGIAVLEACRRHLAPRAIGTLLKHGMIISMRVPTDPSHVGFVTTDNGYPCVLHAYNGGERKCVEHILDRAWLRRIVGRFDFPGIED